MPAEENSPKISDEANEVWRKPRPDKHFFNAQFSPVKQTGTMEEIKLFLETCRDYVDESDTSVEFKLWFQRLLDAADYEVRWRNTKPNHMGLRLPERNENDTV